MSNILDELITKIKKALENLVTLEIVTIVGDVKFQPKSDTEKDKIIATIDYSTEPKAILTKIDLLQGDIQTVFHEDFVTGNYTELREFHAAREAQGHDIVEQNLAALEKLFQLAKKLIRDETDA
jgi:hypothetical protein